MTQQTKNRLREEFIEWSLPNKNRNYPSMIEIADWWLAKLDEIVREEVMAVLPEKRTYKARGINNQYFEDGFNHCYWLILKRLKERGEV